MFGIYYIAKFHQEANSSYYDQLNKKLNPQLNLEFNPQRSSNYYGQFQLITDTMNRMVSLNNTFITFKNEGFQNTINFDPKISNMYHFCNLYVKNSSYETILEINGTSDNTIVNSVYAWLDRNISYNINFINLESDIVKVNIYKKYKTSELKTIKDNLLVFVHGDHPIDNKVISYLSGCNEIYIQDPWNNEVLLNIMSKYNIIEITKHITAKPIFRCRILSKNKYDMNNIINTAAKLNYMLHLDFSGDYNIYIH